MMMGRGSVTKLDALIEYVCCLLSPRSMQQAFTSLPRAGIIFQSQMHTTISDRHGTEYAPEPGELFRWDSVHPSLRRHWGDGMAVGQLVTARKETVER
jgi:hypothetical protein